MKITLKKFEIELSIAEGRFLGIGAVRCGPTLLRSPRLPWTFYTESDQGVRFEDYRLTKVVKSRGGGATIISSPAPRSSTPCGAMSCSTGPDRHRRKITC